MSFQATVYNVMIASPSDVTAERNTVRQVLSEWNDIHANSRNIVLLPVGWETHTTPTMGDAPQSIINRQILESSDLLIGIFWTRIGTATEKYASGAVEEIEKHIKADRPAMLYFSSAPVEMDSVDRKQYDALKKFKESCKSRALYQTYSSLSDFKDKFSKQLQIKLNGPDFLKLTEGSLTINTSVSQSLRLSLEAESLLKAAASSADGQVLRIAYLGGATIVANGNSFVDDNNDARTLATWDGAIRNLEEEGLLESMGSKREIFRVTGKGYTVSDSI